MTFYDSIRFLRLCWDNCSIARYQDSTSISTYIVKVKVDLRPPFPLLVWLAVGEVKLPYPPFTIHSLQSSLDIEYATTFRVELASTTVLHRATIQVSLAEWCSLADQGSE